MERRIGIFSSQPREAKQYFQGFVFFSIINNVCLGYKMTVIQLCARVTVTPVIYFVSAKNDEMLRRDIPVQLI